MVLFQRLIKKKITILFHSKTLFYISVHSHKYVYETSRLKGYFCCSETVFNLSKKALTEAEIKVLAKDLDYVHVQIKVNEPELRCDFE